MKTYIFRSSNVIPLSFNEQFFFSAVSGNSLLLRGLNYCQFKSANY